MERVERAKTVTSLYVGRGAAGAAILTLLLAACGGSAPPPPPPAPDPLAVNYGVEPPAVEAGQVPGSGPYAAGFDALHYDLSLHIPDEGSRIQGVMTMRVALTPEYEGTPLPLDLSGMSVGRVRAGTSAGTMEVVQAPLAEGRVIVPLPGANAGDTAIVEIVYAGEPDDGLFIQNNLHGVRGVFADNWPDRARFWFPSIDHPSDKASVSYTVRAPDDLQVIANGELKLEPTVPPTEGPAGIWPVGSGLLWRYELPVPIPTYTMVIGASVFSVNMLDDCASGGFTSLNRDGCVPVTLWTFPQDSVRAKASFFRSPQMVETLAELIGPYPYEKLAQVQSSTRFGGMENSGAIFYPERALAEGQRIEETVAHEIAHQWFGDGVTEANWSHLWLSEGFATYFGAVIYERMDSRLAFDELMDRHAVRYFESPVVNTPLIDENPGNLFDLLNAVNYQKGAWVLHMIRGEVGDADFFEAMRRFYRENEGRSVLSADLQRVVEEVSGKDLQPFMDQWLNSPGHPVLAAEWRWDSGSAVVEIEQVQPESWPTFHFNLEMEFVTNQGPIRREAEITERSSRVRFRVPGRPTRLVLDPDGNVLIQNAPNQ
ncbi:MAG: M1 family metallopeptidase [Gemmatimonadota bacterium]